MEKSVYITYVCDICIHIFICMCVYNDKNLKNGDHELERELREDMGGERRGRYDIIKF